MENSNQEKFVKANMQNLQESTDTKKVAERTFYARINGCTHIFADGSVAQFTNGQYVTDREWEIKQLDALCQLKGNSLISSTPVHMHDHSHDVIVLKEVGQTPQGQGMVQPQGSTGTVSSAQLAALAAMSTGKSK